MRMDQCEHVISNHTIMNSLNETQFDLVLADPSVMCGELIAAKLKTPFVYNVRKLFEQRHLAHVRLAKRPFNMGTNECGAKEVNSILSSVLKYTYGSRNSL